MSVSAIIARFRNAFATSVDSQRAQAPIEQSALAESREARGRINPCATASRAIRKQPSANADMPPLPLPRDKDEPPCFPHRDLTLPDALRRKNRRR